MKKFRLLFLGFICFFISLISVNANEVKNIDMKIYIDQYGNANVEEIWDVYLDKGTEGYRNYNLMGESEISNFRVTDDTGREYESLTNWNINASFSEKAYKSGINRTSNGIELCWGISRYGNRRYMLKYDISNFVTQYTDKQGIYFKLLDLDQNVGNVDIKIYSDIAFSLDNTRIWAFGNSGEINFSNGSIVMNSGGVLSSSQYITLLVRFEENLFNSNNISSKSFDMIYDEAMIGVELDEGQLNNVVDTYQENIFETLFGLLCGFFGIIAIVFIVVFSKYKNKVMFQESKKYDLYFGVDERKLPDEKDIPYFRDIPCNKDLCLAYWVCYHYNVVKLDDLREGFIGSLLLKWVRDGNITIVKGKKQFLNFKDNDYEVIFNDRVLSNDVERELFKILKSASSDGKILKAYDFSKWCKKNYSQIERWFYNIIGYTNVELEKLGLLRDRVLDSSFNNGSLVKYVDVRLRDEAIKLIGLKKYLLEFSLIAEKRYYEVNLWNEYLMFAKLLGIADKVKEQFSKLHPEFEEVSIINNEVVNIVIRDIAYNGYNSFKESRHSVVKSNYNFSNSTYDYSGSSRSSGGGGSSYSSGGSSARGSSGGGFR